MTLRGKTLSLTLVGSLRSLMFLESPLECLSKGNFQVGKFVSIYVLEMRKMFAIYPL